MRYIIKGTLHYISMFFREFVYSCDTVLNNQLDRLIQTHGRTCKHNIPFIYYNNLTMPSDKTGTSGSRITG